jgi:signal transduction histidine kinase
MTPLSLLLALLLGACLIAWVQREKFWAKRWEKVAKSLGLKARDAGKLLQHATDMYVSRQRAEQQAERRLVFETLLDEISQGLLLADENLRIRYANAPLKKLLHRKEIHVGRPLIEEVRDHQISGLVQESIREKRHTTRRIQMLPSDVGAGANLGGRYFVIEAAPLTADVGGGVWLMIQDVTESAMTEQIRRDFVANASHELRTPLTLINGYIEMLQEDASKVPPPMKRSLDVMEKHGKRIARIIEDMLAISRLEDASSSLNKEPFNVRTCAKDAADHLLPMLEGRDARIEFDFPPDGGQLTGDRFYWDQVFTNLLENSIKENTKPGLVIRVSGEWQDDTCILKVSDNGIGIPAHDLPFVFKRFYRGNKHHSTHSSQVKGTGLGLSIVKRAVEAHGGKIELASSPGIETTFTMRLPLQHTKA